ncbi:hypothetical protein [Nocardiopsis ganjiahuensis]|uniref:hypothetical protein n=1 Tax=Nocardiopsis ganjiahuensis TaxID=239984 RepID=UPI00034AA34E|nr:hypothetical protein [Nocardiopsis ganjiahuensis]
MAQETQERRRLAALEGPDRPGAVRAATAVWTGAVALGAAEAAVFARGLLAEGVPWEELLPGLGVRALVYAVVLAVVAFFHRGHRWARWALALGLGIVGTLSLVSEPVGWLLQGEAIDGLPEPTPQFVAIAVLRTLHLVAVAVGLVLMFRPDANAFFRARNRSGAARPGRNAP